MPTNPVTGFQIHPDPEGIALPGSLSFWEAPGLLVLIGAPGAGKTTFARQLAEEHGVIRASLDDVVGQPWSWERRAAVMPAYLHALGEAARTRLTVADTTGSTPGVRAELRGVAARARVPVYAAMLLPSLAWCRERNRGRETQVPHALIGEVHRSIQRDRSSLRRDFRRVFRVTHPAWG